MISCIGIPERKCCLTGRMLHGILHAVGFDRCEISFRRIITDHTVHCTVLTQNARQCPRIHIRQRRNPLLCKPVRKSAAAAEIRGIRTAFRRDICRERRTRRFKIRFNHPVIADQRKGLHDRLTEITRIGQRFEIAVHTRRKDHLCDHILTGAQPLSVKNHAVFQHQTATLLLHTVSLLIS